MVKNHSDSERGNPLLFPINSKGSFICTMYHKDMQWNDGRGTGWEGERRKGEREKEKKGEFEKYYLGKVTQ